MSPDPWKLAEVRKDAAAEKAAADDEGLFWPAVMIICLSLMGLMYVADWIWKGFP